MKHFHFLAIGMLLACTGALAQTVDRSWVRIKVDGPMQSKIDTIHFVLSNGYVSRTVYATPYDSGVYLAEFRITNSTDILWGYRSGLSLPLIISPNDTLQVTILSEKDGIVFGKRARTCSNLVDMYSTDNRPRVQAYAHEYKTDPHEFVDFMNERLNAHLGFANRFCESVKCTKTFVTWYIKSAYVSYYRNLADYGARLQANALNSEAQRNQFLRARDVIMKNIDLNDPTLDMSSGYYELLKSIFYLYVAPEDFQRMYYTTACSVLLQQKGLTEAERRALNRIQSGLLGSNDTDLLMRLAQRHRRAIHQAVWTKVDPSVHLKLNDIKDPDIKRVMMGYYRGIKDWI